MVSDKPSFTPEEVIDFYRKMGFFQSESNNAVVLQEYANEHGEALDPLNRYDDPYLLALDNLRVWHDDPECVVSEEDQVYKYVLESLATVSQGVFCPRNISEVWASDEGPITVSFHFGTEKHEIRPVWQDDWLDLDVIHELNGLIADTRFRLCCFSDVNFAIAFAVTVEQRRQMITDRDFPFSLVDPIDFENTSWGA